MVLEVEIVTYRSVLGILRAHKPIVKMNSHDVLEGKLFPRASPCVLCVGKTGLVERRSMTRMPCRERIFKILSWVVNLFSPCLRTILVRYDFDDNTSIDSGAEGRCFAKG